MSGGDAVRRPFAKLYCYTQKRQSTQQRNLSLSDCEELFFAVLDLSTRKQSDKETFHPFVFLSAIVTKATLNKAGTVLFQHAHPYIDWTLTNRRMFSFTFVLPCGVTVQ
jgi:hypothetical protein